MPTIKIPVTTYRVSSTKPTQKWGSPGALPLSTAHRVLVKVPIDKVPQDAVIDSAILVGFADRAVASGKDIRVTAPSEQWKSSVTWNTQPSVGSVIDTGTTATTPAEQPLPGLDVTSWAVTRDRNGLRVASTEAAGSGFWVRGSSGRDSQPYLEVTYHTEPDTPGDLRPDGPSPIENAVALDESATVSVPQPILTFAGDDDMTAQRIQYSSTASAADIDYDSGFVAASEGRFDPTGPAITGETGTRPVLTNGGAGVYWRAMTDGPDGQSAWSDWAYYRYVPLIDVTIINPPSTTDDGSPTLEWSTSGGTQQSWKAEFTSGSKTLDNKEWTANGAGSWTPGVAVKVPDGAGRHTLWVRDDVSPRVSAQNAPTERKVWVDFTTTLDGAGTAVDSLTMTYDDPVPTFTGARGLGIPDEVSLFRDGVRVPLWNPNTGEVYDSWAPAAVFFTGTDFTLPDYTARPRTTPLYSVRTRTAGVVSTEGPTVQETLYTPSVWLVDPRTGDKVEVQGMPGDDGPVVEQETSENSILHVPINGGLIVEPKRRRLVRTTRYGTISGLVVNEDEDLINEWAEGDSSLKYRLVFGKVNWPVIIGDYSPQDMFYADQCGPDRVAISLSWYQRLTDV